MELKRETDPFLVELVFYWVEKFRRTDYIFL